MTVPRMLADRYRLERVVGRGGMGAVWQAHDQLLDRRVAIKQLRQSFGLDPEVETREARLAAQLRHPNAVAIHDLITSDGDLWLIMEYVDGPSLSAVIVDGPLPPVRLARLGAQVASALAAAHQLGIVHRDVKPGNVLLTSQNEALLGDFGIARADGDPHITAEGMITGTPAYLAPEVVRGQVAGSAADAWGLGVTLFHAAEGRLPFGEGPTLALLQRIAGGQREPMRAAGPLAPIIDALMAPDPQQRMTMVQAVDALDDVLRRLEQQPLARARMEAAETVRALPAPRSIPAVPAEPTSSVRRRAPWWAVGAVAILMLASGYGLRWATEPSADATPRAHGSAVTDQSQAPPATPAQEAEGVVMAVLVDGLDDPDAAWALIAADVQQTLTGGYDGFLTFWESLSDTTMDQLHCTDDLSCSIVWTRFLAGGGKSTTTSGVLVGQTDDGMQIIAAPDALFVL